MIRQARAFGLSLGIHATACLALLLAGMVAPKTRAVVLDFSIGSAAKAAPAPARRKKAEARPQRTVTPTVQDEQAAPVRKERTDDAPQPVSQEPETANDEAAAAESSAIASSGSGEAAKAAYVSAHFAYIRDKIFRNLAYPPVARRMGWEGKVTVSFIICADGSLEDISVVQSSGFPVLDRNAVDTIRKSCPLPRPPVKTALIMPIVYRLE